VKTPFDFMLSSCLSKSVSSEKILNSEIGAARSGLSKG
jgi:hypothetical protein